MAPTEKRGFSVVELMIVIAISMVLVAVADVSMQPLFRDQHVNNAYNTTMMALRRAHDQAAADMRVYLVTFTAPGTITVTQAIPGAPVLFTAKLPADVTFHVEAGIPTSPTTSPTTPDGFGAGSNFFDFNQLTGGGGNTIYFYPDGTAQDAGPNGGNINNGVVYLGIPGQLRTCRAVTLWGYTSRIRGWHLYSNSGVWTWSQQ